MISKALLEEAPALAPQSPGRKRGHTERLASARRGRSLVSFVDAVEISGSLQIPAAVTEIKTSNGSTPKLPVEAFELARQVYYLQHGSLRDAARAVIAEGLAETDDLDRIANRLRTWWKRNSWPKRPTTATFAIRDANSDGGLFRSERMCRGLATGTGVSPAGEPCNQSALSDSDYCFGHDPRPEYIEARETLSGLLQAGRRADHVPIQPFADWCEATRRQMLTDAKRRSEDVHPNATGWAMLANAMRVDQSQLGRLVKKRITSRGMPAQTVSAATIVRYLEPLDDVTFEDVYGFSAPTMTSAAARLTCPECGGAKNSASAVCRECYDAGGDQCKYRNRRGKQCDVRTEHESGYCHRCRVIVFRERRQRAARPSFVSNPMLTIATGACDSPSDLADVSKRMWATNAAGVCDVFASCKVLKGSILRQFRKRGWTTPEAIAAAHDELVRVHGDVTWPHGEVLPLSAAALLPAAPYVAWLQQQYAALGSQVKLAHRLRINTDILSRRLRGLDNSMVLRSALDQALEYWGDGTCFADIYGGSK